MNRLVIMIFEELLLHHFIPMQLIPFSQQSLKRFQAVLLNTIQILFFIEAS